MKTNYTPGQILCIKSSMGPWYYYSVLHYAKPAENMDNAYELHTCCDLCVDTDGDCLTFARGNGSFLDLDTVFENVRKAYGAERVHLYNALVKAYKNYDLGWTNPTDSTYFDILDWLAWEFDVDLNDEANQYTPVGEAISEIQNYIWDAICKETGNYQEKTVEPKMVSLDTACKVASEMIQKFCPNLIRCGEDLKYWEDEFRKRLEE